jgi:hypothetical protein
MLHLAADGTLTSSHRLDEGHRWYDLRLTSKAHPGFEQRLAGHFENGRPDRSEPMDETDVFIKNGVEQRG